MAGQICRHHQRWTASHELRHRLVGRTCRTDRVADAAGDGAGGCRVAPAGRAGSGADGECRPGRRAGGAGPLPALPHAGTVRTGQQWRGRLCRGAAAGAAGLAGGGRGTDTPARRDGRRLGGGTMASPHRALRPRRGIPRGPGHRCCVRRRPGAGRRWPPGGDATRGTPRRRDRRAQRAGRCHWRGPRLRAAGCPDRDLLPPEAWPPAAARAGTLRRDRAGRYRPARARRWSRPGRRLSPTCRSFGRCRASLPRATNTRAAMSPSSAAPQ